MMQPTPVNTIDSTSTRTSINNGWWDVYLGLLLLAITISAVLEDLGKGDYSLEMMLGIVLLYYIGRRYIIDPRLGKLRFGPRRRPGLQVIAPLAALAALAGLGLWFLSTNVLQLSPGAVLPVLVFAVLAILGFGIAAYMLSVNRLYLYGFLFALSFAALEWMQIPVTRAVPGIAAGLLVMVIGLILLVQFIQTTPLPPEPPAETRDS